jgi:hypothetical protein
MRRSPPPEEGEKIESRSYNACLILTNPRENLLDIVSLHSKKVMLLLAVSPRPPGHLDAVSERRGLDQLAANNTTEVTNQLWFSSLILRNVGQDLRVGCGCRVKCLGLGFGVWDLGTRRDGKENVRGVERIFAQNILNPKPSNLFSSLGYSHRKNPHYARGDDL